MHFICGCLCFYKDGCRNIPPIYLSRGSSWSRIFGWSRQQSVDVFASQLLRQCRCGLQLCQQRRSSQRAHLQYAIHPQRLIVVSLYHSIQTLSTQTSTSSSTSTVLPTPTSETIQSTHMESHVTSSICHPLTEIDDGQPASTNRDFDFDLNVNNCYANYTIRGSPAYARGLTRRPSHRHCARRVCPAGRKTRRLLTAILARDGTSSLDDRGPTSIRTSGGREVQSLTSPCCGRRCGHTPRLRMRDVRFSGSRLH
jgi:hypothetical protein